MKSLTEFKQPIIEEESDYSKFDMLVRAGLANKAQLQRIHKILDKMKEDRPVFNNADRMILQNLFNKMVDLISNNKQIYQQTRRAVREDLEEGILDTSDYKTTASGRKYKAHRIKVGDEQYGKEKEEQNEEVEVSHKVELDESLSKIEPPFVLVLKRKAIRLFPNDTRIALYYSDKINKYFSVPYSTDKNLDAPVQAESVENVELEEAVMDQLHKIVAAKQKQRVKFGNGQTQSVDHYTASAITQVHKALNDDNKKKFADMVHKSPAHLAKAADFAFSKVKK
jgi:hypothetical protein